MEDRLKDHKSGKRLSDDLKDTISSRVLGKVEERSCSEPPTLASTSKRSRLTTIQEKINDESSDYEISKSNNHLNESDLDNEVDSSTSTTLMQTTPTPSLIACCTARRINSEINLSDANRRLSGFLGNKNKRFCASTSELNFSSHLDTRKSLFSPKNNALSRQSFNSSLYGSNLSLNSSNSRLFVTNSPFYDGKTMFGGASAYTKRDITQHKFLRVPVLMRPSRSAVNDMKTSANNPARVENDNKTTLPESNTTKRILEIMNDFKGPLKEVRSMGSNISSFLSTSSSVCQSKKRFNDEDLILERNMLSKNPLLGLSSASKIDSNSDILNSYSAASPTIPTMSQLLRIKKLQSNTERVRLIANRSESFLNKNTEYQLPNVNEKDNKTSSTSSSSSSVTKMKNNLVRNLVRNDNNKKLEEEMPETINLPNIQLPLKNIPKFDITTMQMPTTKATKEVVITTTATAAAAAKTQPQSSIIKQQKEEEIKKIEPKPTQKEEIVKMTTAAAVTKTVQNSCNFSSQNEKFIFQKPLSMRNAENFKLNRTHESNFIFAKPSTVDFSTRISSSFTPSKSFISEVKQKHFSMDDESHVDLCCDNSFKEIRPTASLKENGISKSAGADDLFASLVKKQSSQKWECDACMTRNDENKDKCACCETPRAGSAVAKTAPPPFTATSFGMPPAKDTSAPSADDLFKKIAAKQKSQNWECDSCLTQNEATQNKCVCCDAANPKSSKPSTNDELMMKSNFKDDKSQDDVFKKLVSKQNSKWECSTCMTRNEDSATKCACCEQAKPNAVSNAPQFSFGSFGSSTPAVSLPPPSEVKFSFGMTKSAVELPKPDEVKFSFGATKSAVELPKPAEVKFSFGMNSSNATTKEPETGVISVSSSDDSDSQKSQEKKESTPLTGFSFSSTPKVEENILKAAAASPIPTLLPPAKVEQECSPQKIVKTDSLAKFNDNSTFNFTGGNSGGASSIFSTNANTPKPSSGMFQVADKPLPTINFGFNSDASKSFTNSNNNNSLFQVKKDEVDKPASGGFSFGNNSSTTTSSLFGNKTSSDVKPTTTPVVFGASPSFSSLASNNNSNSSNNNNNNNNNNQTENLFVFGNQTQKRSFDSTFPTSADSSNTQNNFQFNAPNEIKPAFNFTQKQPVQSFSFNNANLNNVITKDTKNIFQFGQPSEPLKITSINSADATPMGAVPSLEIPINPLGSFKTNSNPRKILRATRRTVTRR